MATHRIKSWPEYFEPVAARIKTFEKRENDRGYRPGDTIVLEEWDPNVKKYTGRDISFEAGFILFDTDSAGVPIAIISVLNLKGDLVDFFDGQRTKLVSGALNPEVMPHFDRAVHLETFSVNDVTEDECDAV